LSEAERTPQKPHESVMVDVAKPHGGVVASIYLHRMLFLRADYGGYLHLS